MSNFSIIKKIKRDNIILRLLGAGALLVLTVIIAFTCLPKTTKYLLATKNVFGTTSDHYKENKFYRGKTSYLYDWFAENDDGRFYFAPTYDEAGQEEYLIVYIPDDYQDKADRIIAQTWEYSNTGDDSVLKESINCRGFIQTPNPTTVEYARQYFDLLGVPNEKSRIGEYMFVMVPLKEVLLSGSSMYLFLEAVFIVCAIWVLISCFTKGYLKTLKKRLAKENMTLEDYEAEFANPVINVSNVYVSNKHVTTASSTPKMLKIEDVIWIHSSKSNNVNSNQTVFNSVFYTRNHECVKYPLKDATSAEVLCQAVHSLQPRALYGYVIENSNMYYKHFNELVEQVYNPKEETPAETTGEETTPVTSEENTMQAPESVSETPVSEAPSALANDILTPSSVAPKDEEENL